MNPFFLLWRQGFSLRDIQGHKRQLRLPEISCWRMLQEGNFPSSPLTQKKGGCVWVWHPQKMLAHFGPALHISPSSSWGLLGNEPPTIWTYHPGTPWTTMDLLYWAASCRVPTVHRRSYVLIISVVQAAHLNENEICTKVLSGSDAGWLMCCSVGGKDMPQLVTLSFSAWELNISSRSQLCSLRPVLYSQSFKVPS